MASYLDGMRDSVREVEVQTLPKKKKKKKSFSDLRSSFFQRKYKEVATIIAAMELKEEAELLRSLQPLVTPKSRSTVNTYKDDEDDEKAEERALLDDER